MRAARKTLILVILVCGLAGLGPQAAQGAVARSCNPVLNPYPGTRYADSALRRIRALGVTCRGARRVARRAHYKALGLPVPPTGVRRFRWRDWRVTGDLRGDVDRYVAVRGGRSVRWVFS
ncbi:MAG TPA: hypothetical protein VFB44_08415 [Thermoleophilaceae bacterium]|nr:hypothetical protein [Thermoleophilaceae bacterium]